MIIPLSLYSQKEKKDKLNIVYIGNSITQGALLENPADEAPPVQATQWLRTQSKLLAVEYSNQGVSGSTTVDFLPISNTLFPKTIQAATDLQTKYPKATLLFSIMLGTNDSAVKGPNGSPVSSPQYYTNMKVIVDELLSTYPQSLIVIHRPIYYSPNTYNSAIYLEEGLNRLKRYYPMLQSLVKQYEEKYPKQVFIGDTDAYDYYEANHKTMFIPENGNAGLFYLHPNLQGASKLGEFWGKAIYKARQNSI